MREFLADIRIQQSISLFVISMAIVVFFAGMIIRKTRFFDINKTADADKSISRAVGKYMMAISGILFLVFGMVFLYSLTL